MHLKRRLLVLSLLLGLTPRTAFGGTSNPIVLEVSEGPRPSDAGVLLAPIYAELSRRGLAAEGVLLTTLERSHSRGARALSTSESVAAQKAIDDGYEHFIDGDYTRAAASAQKALDLYDGAIGQLAEESALRDLEFRAFLIAARSHEVLGHGDDAFRLMARAIETFPDRSVNTAEFDPRVNALHRRVKKELQTQGTGTIEARVDDPLVLLYVNERLVGTGTARVDGLFPGRYRVYTAKPAQPGRVHEVEVSAGAVATVSASWLIDSSLRSRPGYVGIELPRDAPAGQDIAIATRVARELGAPTVVLLGVRTIERRRSIVGYAVKTDSLTRIYGAVQIEPITPSADTLAKLGGLLAGDPSIDTSDIMTREPERRGGPQPWYRDRWGWAITGSGAAITLAGAALLISAQGLKRDANDEPRQSAQRDLRDRADSRLLLGSVVGAVGVATLVTGIVKLSMTGHGAAHEQERLASTHLTFGVGTVALEGSF